MELNANLIALVAPITVGVVAVMREAGLPSRWAALAALGVGIGASLAASLGELVSATPGEAVLCGLAAGLASSGLWSGAKAVMNR